MFDKLRYRKPNFNREWLEANRYPEFQELGKGGWLELAPNGGVVKYSDIKDNLENVNLDFDSLERDKKRRFIEAYKTGIVELPIAVKFNDFEYDLLGGNTRLAGLVRLGHNPKIWVVQAPGWDGEESDESLTEKWSEKYKNSIDCNNPKGFSQKAHCQGRKKVDEGEEIKGGLADNKTLTQIAKKHDAKGYYHIVDMVKSLKKELDKGVDIEMEHTKDKSKATEIALDHLWEDPTYYTKLKKIEAKEVTGASSAGAYVGPMMMTKREIHTIHNSKLNETVDSGVSAGAAYDVPLFGANPRGGRKDPLKIDGPESIKKGRAVKDKNFPKWGGPGGVFIKIKEKCKKFPYCNQGDINNIEILRESIDNVSKKYGLPTEEVEKIVLKGIKDIFI